VTKNAFLCGGSVLAVAVSLGAGQAFAADATAGAADAASASATQPGSVVGELVVVAQKREQKIEDVPVAITAFSGKQRDIIGLKTTQDLSNFTPGLSYYSVADTAVIRGIGRNTVNLATAAGVATYYNGVYYGANATIAIQKDSLFIGNVEVDNGPQNTLHGSNADGGVINYVSQKPTSSYYAEGRLGVADYGYIYGEAVVSGPINDHWKFRVGGNYSSQGGGFFTNLEGGQSPGGGFGPQGNGGRWHYWEAQLQGNYDHFDVWSMVSSGEYNTNFNTVNIIGNIPPYEFPTGNLVPSSFFGLCAINATAACFASGQAVVPGSAKNAGPVNASQFPGNNPANTNPYNLINTTPASNQQNNDIAVALTATYHFPGLDVEYIGGYQTFNYNLHFSQATAGVPADAGLSSFQIAGATPAVAASAASCGGLGLPAAFCEAPQTLNVAGEFTSFIEDDQYFSNEVDFISTAKGPFQYLFGAYEYHEHFDQPIDLGCYPNLTQLFTGIVGGATPHNPSGCSVQTDGHITYDDIAGFAHASYDITSHFQFAGGVRYTYDHRYGYEQQRIISLDLPGTVTPTTLGAITPAFDLTPILDGKLGPIGNVAGATTINTVTGFALRTLNASYSAVTGDATLNWRPDTSTLGYVRYARGYKAGGLLAGAFSPVPATKPEYVDDFEGGLKKTWGSTLLVNADVYYYNWYNDQQPIAVNVGGTLLNELFNIPLSRVYGFEFLGQWRPIDPLTLSLTYNYESATIASMGGQCVSDTQDPLALSVSPNHRTGCSVIVSAATGAITQTQNISGNHLPQVPPNKVALNAQYAFHFEPGTLTLSGTFIWQDATFDTVFNEPLSLAPAYDSVNFRAYWEDAKDRFTLIAYVDNAFNQLAFNDAIQTNLAPAPTVLPGGNIAPSFVAVRGLVSPLTFGGEIQVRFR
jgi:iron complex outermembrane receptor protein